MSLNLWSHPVTKSSRPAFKAVATAARWLVAEMLILSLLVTGLVFATPLSSQAASEGLTAQTSLPQHGSRLRPTNPQQTLNLSVALKVQDETALDSFLQALYDPHSPNFRQYLTPAQFTSRFLSSDVRAKVISFLQSKGLSVQDAGLGALINFTGTVAQLQSAFKVQISDYQDNTGRVFYANDVTPALPLALASNVQGIIGLDNFEQLTPKITKPKLQPQVKSNAGTPSGCSAAVNISNSYGSYTPNQFAAAYNFTSLYSAGNQGQGQTVALFELDDYTDSNAAAFQSCFGTSVPLSRIKVDGGATLGNGESEVELDIDVIVGLAPKISQLLVYEAPNGSGILDEYQRIANDNSAQVVSTSWGRCEAQSSSTSLNTQNTIFRQMATQGQSMFAAAGDTGAEDCRTSPTTISVDNPAGQPYVTGVGGTTLLVNASNGYSSEEVWNEYNNPNGAGGAGGGGISTVWPKPSYQTGPGTLNSYSTGKRQVPDVSADADGYTGYTVFVNDPNNCPFLTGSNANNCFEPVGGTSAAAPLWAAGTALVNRYLNLKSNSKLGFANPTIYSIFKVAPLAYHDITVGDNCYDPSCGGGAPASGSGTYKATVGYDQASGVGSFDLNTFATKAAVLAPYTYNLPFLANNAFNFSSFVAFQNIGSAAANISMTYYGGDGSYIASDATCPALVALGECLPSNPFASGTSGQATIASDQPLNVIVAEATPFGGSAYAVSNGTSNSLIEPFAFNSYFGSFNSLYFIYNAGAAPTTATISYFSADGTPVTGATKTVTIAAHANTIVNQTDAGNGLAVGFNGYAQITAGVGSQLSAQVLEYNPTTNFVAIANAQPTANAQATLYAPGIFKNAFGFTTGASIINPNAGPVTINVTYFDGATGNPITTTPFALGPHAVQGIFQGGTGPGLPASGLPNGFSGSAQVTATGGGIFMVVNEKGSSSAQSGVYTAASSGSSKVGLPVMAHNGFGYTTGATILNTSAQSVSGSLQYYDINGQPLGGAQPFTLAPHASQLAYQGATPVEFYGTAVVTQTSGSNSLIVTTNAQSPSIFYTYTEPNQ